MLDDVLQDLESSRANSDELNAKAVVFRPANGRQFDLNGTRLGRQQHGELQVIPLATDTSLAIAAPPSERLSMRPSPCTESPENVTLPLVENLSNFRCSISDRQHSKNCTISKHFAPVGQIKRS
jgi:hypothetical protein